MFYRRSKHVGDVIEIISLNNYIQERPVQKPLWYVLNIDNCTLNIISKNISGSPVGVKDCTNNLWVKIFKQWFTENLLLTASIVELLALIASDRKNIIQNYWRLRKCVKPVALPLLHQHIQQYKKGTKIILVRLSVVC